jgi:hypothetical protein
MLHPEESRGRKNKQEQSDFMRLQDRRARPLEMESEKAKK